MTRPTLRRFGAVEIGQDALDRLRCTASISAAGGRGRSMGGISPVRSMCRTLSQTLRSCWTDRSSVYLLSVRSASFLPSGAVAVEAVGLEEGEDVLLKGDGRLFGGANGSSPNRQSRSKRVVSDPQASQPSPRSGGQTGRPRRSSFSLTPRSKWRFGPARRHFVPHGSAPQFRHPRLFSNRQS